MRHAFLFHTYLPLSFLFLLLPRLPPLQQTLVKDLGVGPDRPKWRHHLRRQRCRPCCRSLRRIRRVEDAGDEVEELGTEAARLLNALRKNIVYDWNLGALHSLIGNYSATRMTLSCVRLASGLRIFHPSHQKEGPPARIMTPLGIGISVILTVCHIIRWFFVR